MRGGEAGCKELWARVASEAKGAALWSVLADSRVVLAPFRLTENWPEALRLQPYGGRLLQFADGVTLRPNPEYFSRHRAFHGFR